MNSRKIGLFLIPLLLKY